MKDFTCRTNDASDTGNKWYPRCGKRWWVQMTDGHIISHAPFKRTASDETIIRSYLRGYTFGCSGKYRYDVNWMEFSLQRPVSGTEQRVLNYYVSISADGKWARVTEKTPVGEMRCDGFKY